MKIYCALGILLMHACSSHSQPVKKVEKGVPVTVTNWDGLALMIIDPVYDNMKDTLVAQLGEAEYERFKNNSTATHWPVEIGGYMWKKADSLQKKAHQEKLGKLRVYRIATYQHVFQGTKWARWAVLRVPYSENNGWDAQVKWDTLYFLVEEKYVKEQK